MGQTVVQSTAPVKWGGTATTVNRTLNGVAAGNRLEVLIQAYGGNTDPAVTVSDTVNTYTAVRAKNALNVNGKLEASIQFALNVPAGNYTVTCTHNGAAANHFGEVLFREVTGGLTVGALDTGVTNSGAVSTATPSITGAGATAQAANLIVAICGVDAATSNVGLNAATGSSLTWTNRIRDQDPSTEVGWAADDAPSASIITPTCSWGTLTGTDNTVTLIVAFKDAAAAGVAWLRA